MRAVLILGGDQPSFPILKETITEDTIVIAADSGADILCKHNIIPNFLVGDMDSIDQNVLEFFKDKTEIRKYKRDKDATDGLIAVKLAMEIGADEVILLGATGKRLDQFIGNLGLLDVLLKNNIKAAMIDEYNYIYLADKTSIIKKGNSKQVSFSAFGRDVENFTIKNARWNLENYHLRFADQGTISNEFLDEDIEIEFEGGTVMVTIIR